MRKAIIFLAALIMAAITAQAVTFKVRVPAGTAKCYVCGAFNEWNAEKALRLDSQGDNVFTLELKDVSDVSGGYKYLCGQSWDYVEKDASGDEIDNRTSIGNPDVVESWRNVPETNIETFELVVNDSPRQIKVYLPDGYDDTQDVYPVIYYNTVQQRYSNSGADDDCGDYFFGAKSWNAQTTMENLRKEGNPAYVMVQICSHMSENTIASHSDYIGTGNAALYLDSFVTTLMPAIAAKYRVDNSSATIVGADYGALFSIYAALTHPELFSRCVAMSPMLWINKADFISMASSASPSQVYYITVGDKEPSWMKNDASEFAEAMNGAPATTYYTVFDNASHNDDSWGVCFDKLLKVLSRGVKPEGGQKEEDNENFKERQFALYSARNETSWSTAFKGLLTYTNDYYPSDSTEPVEAFVYAQTLGSTYTSKYYWNIADGPDNTYGWIFDTPQTIGFSSSHTVDSWQRVAVLADGTVKNAEAMYNAFTVRTGAGSSVKMTSDAANYKATATVSFGGSDKTFAIRYGSVNSGSDMGAITATYSVSEHCTEAQITFDFILNKVTFVETKTDEANTDDDSFEGRVYTLYASDKENDLKPVGTFVYTSEYYKKGSGVPTEAFYITHEVAATYKSKCYWNIAKGATSDAGWLMASPKDITFSSSHNTVSWLNVAVYEDGTVDNIAAHSSGFTVVKGSGTKVAMTQNGGHTSKATVPFAGSDKTFTVHFGSVNSASDQGAVTPVVSVSDRCLEAEITYDFDLNKVTFVETKTGDANQLPRIDNMQALPAVTTQGQDVTVTISLNKSCVPQVTCKKDNSTTVAVALTKVNDIEYLITLSNVGQGIYTFNVTLTDGTTTVADAASINVRVLPASSQKIKDVKMVVNPYESVNWETTGRFKANFHTHTSQSFDTEYATSDVVDRYQGAGYKILALTDHDANSYPWSMFDLYNSKAEPRDPKEMGMLAIPANELSKDRRNNWSESTGGEFNHHNDLFTGRKGQEFMSLRESYAYTQALGGMQIINHPGQYWNLSTEYSAGAKNSPEWHAENFKQFSSLIGLEVYNQGDRRQYDRILWDQILSITMPQRPVWGYSCDDTHTAVQYFRNYEFMLMENLALDDLKTAMINGATVFSYQYEGVGEEKAPHINSINIDQDNKLITIDTDDADNIEWIYSTHRTGSSASTTQSTVVAAGNKFDYTNYQGSYVRARLINSYGETATQPFGFTADVASETESALSDKTREFTFNHDTNLRVANMDCTEPMLRATVFNVNGQIVKYVECGGETHYSFSTGDLAPGAYITVVATTRTAYTAKFIVN